MYLFVLGAIITLIVLVSLDHIHKEGYKKGFKEGKEVKKNVRKRKSNSKPKKK
jgi:hypothetical protein